MPSSRPAPPRLVAFALALAAAAGAKAGAPPPAAADEPSPPSATPSATAPAPAGATAEPVSAFFFATNAKVRSTIDLHEVRNGLLRPNPKDGIPAIRRPEAVPASEADWVKDDDRVIGVAVGEQARAYPILQMQRHEVVNDVLSAEPVAVTYCPLCDSAVAFRRTLVQGKERRILTFGISGFLHQSDVLLYDAETETFWQQYTAKAVVGPLTGTALPEVPRTTTTWRAWREAYPETTVLSWKTEHRWPKSAYAGDVYADYHRSRVLQFPVTKVDPRLPAKTIVHGVVVGDAAVAVPDAAVRGAKEPREAHVGDATVRFLPADAGGAVRAERRVAAGEAARWEAIPTLRSYWFAWATFHPETALEGAPASDPAGPAPAAGGGSR